MPKPKTRDHDISIRALRDEALEAYEDADQFKREGMERIASSRIHRGAALNMAAEFLVAIQGPIERAHKKAKRRV